MLLPAKRNADPIALRQRAVSRQRSFKDTPDIIPHCLLKIRCTWLKSGILSYSCTATISLG